MNSPLSLAISVLVLLSAAGIGRACGRLWLTGIEDRLERFVISAAMGLGILSLVYFLLGVLQLYQFKPLILIVAASGLVFVPRMAREWRREKQPGKRDLGALVAWTCLAVIGLCALIPAMAPPVGDDWDSLAYHLAVPKLFLQHGGIYYISFTSHSNFPLLTEMLYLPGLAIGSPVAAKLMHFWIGFLLVLSVYVLGRRCVNAAAGRMAALIVAGMHIVLWEATTAYVDLASALYAVLAACFLIAYLEKGDGGSLVGCAVAAGFAASAKMTGLAVIPLLVLWLLFDRYVRSKRLEWKQGLVVVGAALLVCCPWYIKSVVYTANPVYPFFYSVFGGRDWTQGLASFYSTQQAKFGLGHGIGAFLALPYNLALKSYAFHDPGMMLFVGPIMLIGVPMVLLLIQKRNAALLGLLWFFLAQVVVWFMLSHQSRYLIPALAVLAVIVAGVAHLDDRMRLLRAALWLVFGVVAVFSVRELSPVIATRAAVAIGAESWDSYLSGSCGLYRTAEWVRENLPADAKIALYGDTRGFYLDRAYVWADPGHNRAFTRDFRSGAELSRYLKSQHITHVIVNRSNPAWRPENAAGVAAAVWDAVATGRLFPISPPDLSADMVFEVH